MAPTFTRDIQRTLLWIPKNLLSDLLLRGYHPLRRSVPEDLELTSEGVNGSKHHMSLHFCKDSVCPLPCSIAFTNGISIDFFSCGY